MTDMTTAAAQRSIYKEGCLAAHALDLLGDRWALLVIRELMLGSKRFQLLRAGMPGLSASVLTQRLASLEAAGLVRRRTLPEPAAVQVYDLTEPGRATWPVIEALSMATPAPVPIATPTSAWASAGASLTPSPAIATLCPSL